MPVAPTESVFEKTMTDKPQPETTSDKVKSLMGNAAKLAKKQAALTKINSVSLSKVHHAIGKRIATLGNLPADLIPLRDKIKQLESKMAAAPEQPKTDEQAGFSAKAKQLAARASKAAGDAAATVQIQAAYVLLGKQAAEKHVEALIPHEVIEEYRTLVAQRDGLKAEIEALSAAPGQGPVTPKRLAIAGAVACLLLGLTLARSGSAWLFGSRNSSLHSGASPQAVGATKEIGRQQAENSGKSTIKLAGMKATPTAKQCVQLLVGDTSNHYSEYGFKGVRLGQSYASVKQKHALYNSGEYTGMTFLYEDDQTGESFIFDDKDRLVSYGQHYEGGVENHAARLVELFGKAAEDRMQTRDETPFNSPMRVTYMTIDYTFPKVLARVIFEDRTQQGANVGKLTHVFVADREWVEAILLKTAEDKIKAIKWLQSAAGLARQGVFDPAKLPAIAGTRVGVVPGQGHCLEFIDTKREADLKPHWGADATKLATCAGVEQSLPGLEPVVYFDCFRYSGTRLGAKVKVVAQEAGRFPEMAEPIQQTPILNDWLWKLNQILMEQCFPPVDGSVNLFRKPELLGVKEWLEWTSKGDGNDSWKVSCGKNLAMRVEYLGR